MANPDSEILRKTAAIAGMAENFGKDISSQLLQIWLKLLDPYPAELVEMAALKLICEYEYKTMPPFAVLKKYLEPERPDQTKGLKIMAEAEWHNLLSAIGKYGSYKGQPDDLHPTTAYVLRSLGGWDSACLWTGKNLDFKRRDFIETWQNVHGNETLMLSGAYAIEQSQAIMPVQEMAQRVISQMQEAALQ